MKQLFSTQGLLTIVALLGIYWVFFGEDKQESRRVASFGNTVIGVSNQLNPEALAKLGVDLSENLDPQIVPALMSEALKETTQANVSEQDFLPTLASNISNKIQGVSTIDLNGDGLTDPVLVMPQSEQSGDEFLVFSILVPDPSEVSSLPAGSDQAAWLDIAKNKSIEVMTASVVKKGAEEFAMQASPNPQMYNSAGAPYPPYYSYAPSMTGIFMTSFTASLLANYLFMPRYPMGFGGYMGAPRAVSTVQSNRSSRTAGLSKANGSSTPARTTSGKSVAANKFKPTSTKSLNKVKSSQFRAATRSKSSGGGFGQSKSTSSSRKSFNQPTKRRSFGTPTRRRRSFGFGRRRR
ncbi:MAG TPA: hypothetical protein DDY54_08470 [Deltaproteobacteria bacterium]|nr:hypothetical protein [Deltaproteobacteria bacterium]